VRRITKAAVGSAAGCALILGATQMSSGESPIVKLPFWGTLTDLNTAPVIPDPAETTFDKAKATLRIMETPEDGTSFKLTVEGIDESAAGTKFGSHLHTGVCKQPTLEDLDPTKGHYMHDPELGATPTNEVWFDVVPSDNGVATDDAFVAFVPVDDDGLMSIVIHQKATDPQTGKAGTKEVCLPLSVSQWKPLL
jgi:hypothetical protein